MGQFDDLTSDLPPAMTGGRFDDLTANLPSAQPQLGSEGNYALLNVIREKSPWRQLSNAMPKIAAAGAEELGKLGVNPYVSATAMLPTAIAPKAIPWVAGLAGVEGDSNLAKAIQNTPSDLGPQYAAQNEVAKISGELPVRSGKLPGYPKSSADLGDLETAKNLMLNPPVSYPKDPAALINLAKNRVEAFGPDLTNQELNDYDSMLGDMLKMGENRLNSQAGKGAFGIVGALKNQVHDLLSKGVTQSMDEVPYWPEDYEPSREALDRIYALSKKLRVAPEVAGKIWSYLGPKLRWGSMLIP